MTITEKLSSYFSKLKFDDLPNNVIEEAKICILDSLGCMLAGSQVKNIETLKDTLSNEDLEKGVSLFGFVSKASLYDALILNGSMGHAVEMDDVHKNAKAHAGAVVVPAALTVGETLNSTGKDLILSVINGYEVMLRIGRGINATEHRMKGWHATGTCGSFGSAAAIASLNKFSTESYMNALGLAGTQASGLWAFTANGANSKMFHAGSAALSGNIANQLVVGGLTGSDQIIEAQDGGLFKAASEDYSYDAVVEDLGESFLINDITRKPYACCRSMHPSIEAAIELRSEIEALDEIQKIKVYTYEVAKIQCGYTNSPQNISDAKFSIPYGVAVALLDGTALLDQFSDERIKDPRLLSISEKVEVIVEQDYDDAYPNNWGCRLEIQVNDKDYIKNITNAKGDPTRPLSMKEVEEKFIYLSQDRIGERNAIEIIEFIQQLEESDNLNELIQLCKPYHSFHSS